MCVVDVLVELHCEVGQDGKLNRNDSRMVIEKIVSKAVKNAPMNHSRHLDFG